jgi:hypothetical protein
MLIGRSRIPQGARAKDGAKGAPWKTQNVFHFRTGPATAAGCSHRRIMADVGAESMFGGTMFRREMIQREISRALVLNLSGETSGARHCPGYFCP